MYDNLTYQKFTQTKFPANHLGLQGILFVICQSYPSNSISDESSWYATSILLHTPHRWTAYLLNEADEFALLSCVAFGCSLQYIKKVTRQQIYGMLTGSVIANFGLSYPRIFLISGANIILFLELNKILNIFFAKWHRKCYLFCISAHQGNSHNLYYSVFLTAKIQNYSEILSGIAKKLRIYLHL